MKVALVCPYDLARPGGVQNQVRQICHMIRGAGDEAWVVGPGVESDLGIDVGRTLVVRANRSQVPIALDPKAVGRTRAGLAGADVVHLHEPLMPLIGPAALATDHPMVLTSHAAPPRWATPAYRLAPRRWWQDRVLTAVSAAAARPWRRPVRIIPNGVDVAAFRIDVARRTKRAVFLGRNDPRKGLSVLLTAWEEVGRRLGDAELVILGVEGPVGHGVFFRGVVSEQDKRIELSQSSVYVAPNLGGESFGITLAEAMAAGCAVVASNIEAFRDTTAGGARLVPPGDVTALAQALVELLDQPEEAEALAALGKKVVGRYDWSMVMPRYRDCYQAALAGRQPHPG